jgi:P pilus assembly chaperone PapD
MDQKRTAMKTKNFIKIFFLIFIISTVTFNDASASGEMMIAPTRVVFEGSTRTARVSLVNSSTETKTYRITFVNKRMTEDGGIVDVDKPQAGELFSDKIVIYSPRQVTLAPGQAQTIRLILRKPANLADGEYRSYLLFRALPKTSGTDISNLDQKQDGIAIQLTPIIGIAIPVIVRHGETRVSTSISEVKYQQNVDKIKTLTFFINREGNASVYGDITVSIINNGIETVVSKVNGVAVYSPNARRKFILKVHLPDGITSLHGKTVKIQYKKQASEGGEVITSETIQIE